MRVFVFIDYQNIYRTAREAFGWENHAGQFGNVRPLALARHLAGGDDRELRGVHVYTGIPTPQADAKGYGAMQRRTQAWQDADPDLVTAHTRPLRYPPQQGREKGIDVELALDLVRCAIDDHYDIGVLASADSDLVPALEFITERCPDIRLETVSIEPMPGYVSNPPIDVPGGGVTRRTVTQVEFERVADRTNYLIARTPAPAPGQSGRRLPPGRR